MQYWALTDPGCVRPQNQDAYKIETLDNISLLCVVCDGMGGAKSGNIASTLAADVFVQSIASTWKPGLGQDDVDAVLHSAVKLANFTVYDQALEFVDFAGMGTTLVAVLVQGKTATVVNVGDSRLYHITPGQIRQVTRDHSMVQMMVDRGELTPQEAKTYPGKNMITRAVGTETAVQCDLFHLQLDHGDSLLLCTDGLSNLMDEQEMLFEVVYEEDGRRCCQRLMDIALNRGAPDNVTCVLMQV